jgi:hypothetical protein
MTKRRRCIRWQGNLALPYDEGEHGQFAFENVVWLLSGPDERGRAYVDVLPSSDAEQRVWDESMHSYFAACEHWRSALESNMRQSDRSSSGRRRTETGWENLEPEETRDGMHEVSLPLTSRGGWDMLEELSQLGTIEEFCACVRRGVHRTRDEEVLYFKLALFVATNWDEIVVAALARRLSTTRPTVYQLRRKGEEIVTILEELKDELKDAIAGHIDRKFDEQTTLILSALGLRSGDWADDILEDEEFEYAA